MAKVGLDPILKWFTGKIGKLAFRRSHSGKQTVSKVPDILKMARKKKKNNRPFDMAISDYFKGNNLLTKGNWSVLPQRGLERGLAQNQQP